MISKQVELRRKPITIKNEYIFKQESHKWFEMGIIPESLYKKIQETKYCKVYK